MVENKEQLLKVDLKSRLKKGIEKAEEEAAKKRIHEENKEDPRSLFEKEYDKVVFSDYLRKLANKTQVVAFSENDYTHSRLTHSLEVARVGKSFGQKLQRYLDCECGKEEAKCECTRSKSLQHLPEIIATACLLHDIGNPPFGHAGEDAIKAFFKEFFARQNGNGNGFIYKKGLNIFLNESEYKDFASFDGNANGFRIITKLAGKCKEEGYKLSGITLAAYTKYPFSAGNFPNDPDKDKFGYFQAELDRFLAFSKLLPVNNKRHPLSYLVEAADDICNRVMDFEDAIKNGHISFNDRIFSAAWESFIGKILEKSDSKARNDIGGAEEILRKYNPNKPILIEELKALEVIRAEAISFFVKALFKNYSDSSLEEILQGKIISLWDKTIEYYGEEEFEEHIVDNYLRRSLYCHRRKADIEIAGYKIIRYILKLLFCTISDFKSTDSFKDCSTKTQHLLRYLGIYEDNYHATKSKSDYELGLIITDFITKCSDKELLSHYQDWMGIALE